MTMLVHVTVHCGRKQPTFDGRLEGELIAIMRIKNYFRGDRLDFHRHVCVREFALPDLGHIRVHGMTASADVTVWSLLFVFKIPKTSSAVSLLVAEFLSIVCDPLFFTSRPRVALAIFTFSAYFNSSFERNESGVFPQDSR
jgi:hypothetical protein